MDHLHRVLLKNNYPDWVIKESEKKPVNIIINPDTGLEDKKNVFISVPHVLGLSKEFRRIFQHTGVQVIFKGANTLKSILMHPEDKIPSQLKQNKYSCQEEKCNPSYLRESSRCLKNRVNKHNSIVTSAFY